MIWTAINKSTRDTIKIWCNDTVLGKYTYIIYVLQSWSCKEINNRHYHHCNKYMHKKTEQWLEEKKRTRMFTVVQFSSVPQSCPTLCDPMNRSTPGPLSITNSRSSLRLTSIESVMPSSHLILCRPLLLLPPIPPSSRVFSNESTLHMRWPKYWSFSFSISPSNEHPGLISFRMD